MKKRKQTKNVFWFLLGFLIAIALFSLNHNGKFGFDEPVDGTLTGKANIVAVDNRNEGLLGSVNVQVREGNGNILINTNPFLEPDTQQSATIAVEVAERYTQIDLSKSDVIFDFDISSNVVGGPSAGAAMTLALISALEHKNVRGYIVVTGTIIRDGTIGDVGGIPEKANAASLIGIKKFYIPAGQNTFVYYEEQIKARNVSPGVTLYNRTYIPKTINLKEYYQENSQMEIIEVRNISDLVQLVF